MTIYIYTHTITEYIYMYIYIYDQTQTGLSHTNSKNPRIQDPNPSLAAHRCPPHQVVHDGGGIDPRWIKAIPGINQGLQDMGVT